MTHTCGLLNYFWLQQRGIQWRLWSVTKSICCLPSSKLSLHKYAGWSEPSLNTDAPRQVFSGPGSNIYMYVHVKKVLGKTKAWISSDYAPGLLTTWLLTSIKLKKQHFLNFCAILYLPVPDEGNLGHQWCQWQTASTDDGKNDLCPHHHWGQSHVGMASNYSAYNYSRQQRTSLEIWSDATVRFTGLLTLLQYHEYKWRICCQFSEIIVGNRKSFSHSIYNGVFSWKNYFAPCWSKFFPLKVTPFEMWDNYFQEIFLSLGDLSILLNSMTGLQKKGVV